MEIKELMIGDWIYDCHDYYNRCMEKQPTQLDRESFDDLLCSCTSHNDLDLGCMYQAIPLSEEILEANGFEKYDNLWQSPKKAGIILELDECDTTWYRVKNTLIELFYVHDLQHALRLCGLDEIADNFKIKQI